MIDWVKAWQAGVLDISAESAQWLQDRPRNIHKLMIKFPPSCLVKANIDLAIPAPNTIGIVTSYHEPDADHPDGLIGVRANPDALICGQCLPEWLEVVGYYKGEFTPELMKNILGKGTKQ